MKIFCQVFVLERARVGKERGKRDAAQRGRDGEAGRDCGDDVEAAGRVAGRGEDGRADNVREELAFKSELRARGWHPQAVGKSAASTDSRVSWPRARAHRQLVDPAPSVSRVCLLSRTSTPLERACFECTAHIARTVQVLLAVCAGWRRHSILPRCVLRMEVPHGVSCTAVRPQMESAQRG